MFPSSQQLQGSTQSVQSPKPMPKSTFPSTTQIQQPASIPAAQYYGDGVSGQTQGLQTGGNTTSQTTYVDPYAAWGGKAAYDSLVSGYNTQKDEIHSTANEAANTGAGQMHSSILDYLYNTNKSQNAINESSYQNELARRQGYTSILDAVGRGIRSGGVLLAQRNATNGSAADQLARAYQEFGNRENAGVNQQYNQGLHSIDLAMQDLGAQRNLGLRKLRDSKSNYVNNIVLDARNRLAALDAQMSGDNITNRFDIEQERAAIKNDVLSRLSQFDDYLAEKDAAIKQKPISEQRVAAYQAQNVAPTNSFDFTTAIPTQFQNTGAFNSSLPIFTAPRRKTS